MNRKMVAEIFTGMTKEKIFRRGGDFIHFLNNHETGSQRL